METIQTENVHHRRIPKRALARYDLLQEMKMKNNDARHQQHYCVVIEDPEELAKLAYFIPKEEPLLFKQRILLPEKHVEDESSTRRTLFQKFQKNPDEGLERRETLRRMTTDVETILAGGAKIPRETSYDLQAAVMPPPDPELLRRTIRIADLTQNTTEDDLHALFSRYGRLDRIYISRHHSDRASKGFGFIVYASETSANLSIEKMDRFAWDSQILQVTRVDRMESTPSK